MQDELSHLLAKVKELISENELLQDQQKTGLMKVMFEGMDEGRLNEFQVRNANRITIISVFEMCNIVPMSEVAKIEEYSSSSYSSKTFPN